MTTRKLEQQFGAGYDELEGIELTMEEIRHALRRAAVIKKAVSKYLELAKEIPQVVECVSAGTLPSLWTIISEPERLPEP